MPTAARRAPASWLPTQRSPPAPTASPPTARPPPPAVRALNWEGRFLVIGFPAGIPALPLNLTLLKSCQIVGVFWGAFVMSQPEANAANLAELFALYEEGTIKPHISARFPLDRAADAITELAERRAEGKVVVTVP